MKTSQKILSLIATFVAAPLLGCQWHWVNPVTVLAAETTQPAEKNKWEKDIAEFETADAKEAPPKNSIVFVGSSTVRFWEVKKLFPDLPVVNRGFGGSEMSDAAYFESRIVSKYQPRLVVLYSGDNDLNAGKKPADIFGDYSKFADHLHAEAPEAKLIVISIKPSPSRWKLMPLMTETNHLIEADAKARGWVTYFNAVPLLLGQDGTPPKGLFRADGLHMNDNGYKLWSDALAAAADCKLTWALSGLAAKYSPSLTAQSQRKWSACGLIPEATTPGCRPTSFESSVFSPRRRISV